MPHFVPLRVRSHGSLLWGTPSPSALIGRAASHGLAALALTDRDNLYLAIAFYRDARAEGVRPILGAEITLGGRLRGAEPGRGAEPVHAAGRTVLLLAIDRRGYAHLCDLVTRRHLDPAFDVVPALAELHAGLHVIVESPELAAALLAAGVPAASGAFGAARAARAGGVWFGVRGLAGERRDLARRFELARRLGVPPVATGDVALLDAADHDAHRAAVTAAAGELCDRMPASAFAAREAWFASPAEWERRVRAVCSGAGLPDLGTEALANNRALVERCRLDLELGMPIFPKAPLPAGVSGPDALRAECLEGVRRRYGGGEARGERASARRRLARELEFVERMGFTDYFLLVAEIVRFARAQNIPTVGRGSGASSIVSYVLGITNVDPMRHGLYFERFLHPARRDCPDLDIDLCWKRRDEVIAHVYDTYGHDRVAMISTHATLGARSAFRETAKALGVPNARVNELARRVPHELEPPYRERLERLPEASRVDWSEAPLPEALRLAEKLDGAPRHLSVHCGGLVIADRPLTHYVPLERAAKDVVVTQFEMRAIEAIGLVKMDLLGNRALSTMSECVELARARRGVEVRIDAIPAEDPLTASRLAAGDTLNGFQLESPAMRHLLRMLRCGTLEETIAAVALVRPGAAESGMKEAYCRRHRGLEPATFKHPRLLQVLGSTHGCMLYEEDVMCVASAIAGLTLAEGDDLRRAIGKARGDEEFRSLERGFVGHCARAGVGESVARDVWRDLARFAAYAFCKAHAAGYGTLGWQSVWLKARFPAEWAVGVLNHHAGMYATWVHVEDLRRAGVRFEAPCVQRSAWETTLEADGGVRVGLQRVFGLSESLGARIVNERPYRSLADFVDRVRPALPDAESLVQAGAFDWTGRTRPSLLLEARVTAAAARGGASRVPARRHASHAARRVPVLAGADGVEVLPEPVAPVGVPALPEFDLADRVRGELHSTGLWFAAHPLDVMLAPGAARGAIEAAAIEGHVGERAALVGLPCAYRRVETKGGGLMLFMTLADRSGLAECVLFPDAYRALGPSVRGEIVRAEGRIEETLGAITLHVERASGFGAEAPRPRGDQPSRNRVACDGTECERAHEDKPY